MERRKDAEADDPLAESYRDQATDPEVLDVELAGLDRVVASVPEGAIIRWMPEKWNVLGHILTATARPKRIGGRELRADVRMARMTRKDFEEHIPLTEEGRRLQEVMIEMHKSKEEGVWLNRMLNMPLRHKKHLIPRYEREGISKSDIGRIAEMHHETRDALELKRDSILEEMRGQAKRKGTIDQADIAFADLVRDVLDQGQRFDHAIVQKLIDQPMVGLKKGGDQVDLARAYSARIIAEGVRRGWFAEDAKTGEIRPSDSILRLAELVDQARWRSKGYHSRPKMSQWYLGRAEEFPRWRCSDCGTFAKEMKEEAAKEEKKELEKGEDTVVSTALKRMSNLLFKSRETDPAWSALTHLGTQFVHREQGDRFSKRVTARMGASLANRVGDWLAIILGKHGSEKAAHWREVNPRFLKAEGPYRKLLPDVHKLSKEELDALRADPVKGPIIEEIEVTTRVLNGDLPESALDKFPARAREAHDVLKELREEFRSFAAEHLFRLPRRAAEKALDEGLSTPQWVLEQFPKLVGQDQAARDPQVALDRMRMTFELTPHESRDVAGMKIRGWGLREYFPHMRPKTHKEGDGLRHIVEPANEPDADVFEQFQGKQYERWKIQTARAWDKQHGFIGRRKFMPNLMSRLKDKDGWIEDWRYAFREYMGKMIDTVYHERLADELDPLVLGKYEVLQESPEWIHNALNAAATANTSEHNAVMGSIEGRLGVRITGNPMVGRLYVQRRGKWVKAEGRMDDVAMEEAANQYRSEMWRWDRQRTRVGGEQKDWTVVLQLGKTRQLRFNGWKNIKKAGIATRTNGIANFQTGELYTVVKDYVREALGWDMDTGKLIDLDKSDSTFSRVFRKAADALNTSFYGTTLGGVVNFPAYVVQFVDGTIRNVTNIDAKTMAEVQPDMVGAHRFFADVQLAKDTAVGWEAAVKKHADLPFVKKVLPILEDGRWEPAHVLRLGVGREKHRFDRFHRANYLAFTLGDLVPKSTMYYAAYKKGVEIKNWEDSKTGQSVEIVPEYIPTGDLFTSNKSRISAHDFARMQVERAHFATPKYAQPGLMKLPGWGLFGHLGTHSTNITFEFFNGLLKHMPRYLKKGEEADLWLAQNSARQLAGLMALYALMGYGLNTDVGEYTGAHVSEVGVGDFNLGNLFPATRGLDRSIRVYGLQTPRTASLPVNFLFGLDNKGVLSSAGDTAMRFAGGEDLGVAAEDAFKKFWKHNARTFGYGYGTRYLRHVGTLMQGGATRTSPDPERPWMVQEKDLFGKDVDAPPKYRTTTGLIADMFFPGRPFSDVEDQHSARWSALKLSQRSTVRSERLRRLARGSPEEKAEAAQWFSERGIAVNSKRVAQQVERHGLPAIWRSLFALRGADSDTKVMMFAEIAKGRPRAELEKAWRATFGVSRRLGQLSKQARKSVSDMSIRNLRESLR